jgi:hypothetical protein
MITRNYANDPSISFSGVGDAYTDKAPLQVADFRGISYLNRSFI